MDTSALSSICNGFGHIDVEENRYVKGKYCLDNLKDLQRFLRRDDPAERPVFKQVCRWNVVGRELVPLLESSQNDQKIVINIVKVLVFLTMPVDPTSEDIPQQVDYLWQSKGVLARNVTIALIVSLLEEPLEHLESATFTEDDWKLVQLVFTLFRNLLAVQDVLSQQNKSGSSTQYLQLREHFLELLFEENVMDLILVLVQHINDTNGYLRRDNLLLLEIFHYIFHGNNPELLAKASTKNLKVTEGLVPNVDSVSSIMAEKEKKSRPGRARNVKHCSNFDGIFTCRTIDGNKALVKGHPSSILDKFLVKARRVQRGPLKKIALDTRSLSLPNDSVLKLLCNFLNTFLSGGYNDLMQSVLEDIEKDQDHLQSGDISIFFQVACFVIAFQRHKFSDFRPQKDDSPTSEASADKLCISADGDICSPIAATLNERMLFLVISKWREAFDSLKQTHDYQTLSSTGSLMKNMIRMLDLLLKVMPDDSSESRTARVLLYKLFYDQTAEGFTQFLLNQIKSFDTHKQAKSDLVDLVEILHVILRLMENLQQRGSLRVSRKSQKGRKKKPSGAIAEAEKLSGEPIPVPDDNDSYGKSLLSHANLGKSLNQSLEASATQFHDDAADAPLDPTGEPGMHTLISENHIKGLSQTDIVKASHDLSYQTDGSSDDEYQQVTNEVDFNVSKLVSEFATSSAIQNICWLLKFCKTNSPSTNYYIVRMLQRICNDLELSPLLYQLSFLVTFYDILSDEKVRKRCPDIVCFLTKLVRGMMKKIKNQPLLFVDILFLKSRKDCHMINAESIEHELGYMKNEIEGLHGGGKRLTKGFVHSSHKNLAEALGEDEADHIFPQELQNDMEAPFRDELQDLDKPTETENNGNCMATIDNGDLNADKSLGDGPHQRESTRRKKLIITHEQEMVIRDLYEKFKEERRCTHLISEALDSQGKISPLQVSCKLRQLGLKVSRRENRHAHSHCPSREIQNEGSKLDGVATSCHPFRLEDNSLLNSHRRKRIHAFNQDQETLIKDLFEQFKGSKKCSRMIANALDDSKYTAAQVSRKLKQLGLLPQRKKETNDRNSSVVEANSEENSDDETLLTMISRSKNKRRKISNKKSQNGHADLLHHGSKSDREPSSSLLNRDFSHLSMPEKNDAAEEIIELASLDDELEDEIYVDGSKQTEDPAASDLVIHELDKIDELADSGEDLGGTTYVKRLGMRRKLTIDVGYEDDD